MKTNSNHEQPIIVEERAIMKEWHYIQQSLFHFLPTTLHEPLAMRRQAFQQHIARITEMRARIWWEAYPTGSNAIGSRLLEICYRQIRYGVLELINRYLESSLIPGIPQQFADLCALLLYTAEHEQFIAHYLAQFPLLVTRGARVQLTPREKDVLVGLIRGESEEEMALRLGIGTTTVHTHRRRLYSALNVDSAQQAVFRAFELRLVDWLDLPERDMKSRQ